VIIVAAVAIFAKVWNFPLYTPEKVINRLVTSVYTNNWSEYKSCFPEFVTDGFSEEDFYGTDTYYDLIDNLEFSIKVEDYEEYDEETLEYNKEIFRDYYDFRGNISAMRLYNITITISGEYDGETYTEEFTDSVEVMKNFLSWKCSPNAFIY
jgi:hypothetical protein